MLHLSDGIAGKKSSHCHLVVPRLRDGTIQVPGREQPNQQFRNGIYRLVHLGQDHPLAHTFANRSDNSPKDMNRYQQQNPTHTSLYDIPREIA